MSTNRIAELGAWVENLQASREIGGRNANTLVQAIIRSARPANTLQLQLVLPRRGRAEVGATRSRRPTVGDHHAAPAPNDLPAAADALVDAIRGIRAAGAHVR